jgi:hypothetical protein
MPCGLLDSVELEFRNPIYKAFDEALLDIELVLPLRQSRQKENRMERFVKDPYTLIHSVL